MLGLSVEMKFANLILAINLERDGDWTWQVPRADFDDILAKATRENGVEIEFETEVIDICFEGRNSVTTLKNKNDEVKQIHSKFVIDSTVVMAGYCRGCWTVILLCLLMSRISPECRGVRELLFHLIF